MTMRFYDLHQLPSKLPIWQLILDDLGNPPPKRIAEALELRLGELTRFFLVLHAPLQRHLISTLIGLRAAMTANCPGSAR